MPTLITYSPSFGAPSFFLFFLSVKMNKNGFFFV
jgi:hypothetical protein